MNEEALRQAREVLTELQQHERKLANAGSIDEIEREWGLMLDYADRIHQKLNHAKQSAVERKWHEQELTLRKEDPFLSYVHQARNAQHHGIKRVTERGEGLPMIREEDGSLLGAPAIIAKLVPVTNRGKMYPVPERFGDFPLNDRSIQSLGQWLEMAMRALVQGAEHVHRTGRLEA